MQRRELKFQINGCCTMEHNRQYLQMLAAAREKLSGMAPGQSPGHRVFLGRQRICPPNPWAFPFRSAGRIWT